MILSKDTIQYVYSRESVNAGIVHVAEILFYEIPHTDIDPIPGFDACEAVFRLLKSASDGSINEAYGIALDFVNRSEGADSEIIHKYCDGLFEVTKLHLNVFYEFDLIVHAIRIFSHVHNLLHELKSTHAEGFLFVGNVLEESVKTK